MIRGMLVIEGGGKDLPKEFRQLVKAGLVELVTNWHRKILPHHFKKGAERKYKYLPRTIRYTRRKAKEKPMAGPLEYTGKSKRMLMRSVRVSGTSKIAKGVMKAPRYFWMRPTWKPGVAVKPGGSVHPDMAAEATAVTKGEAVAMAKRLNERVSGQLNMIRKRRMYR